jgi:EpsI family protein
LKRRTALLFACVVFAAGAVVSHTQGDPVDVLRGTVDLSRPLAEAIPEELAGWRMLQDDELREYELEITKVDDYVSRLYEGPRGESVLLYIAYHGNKERGMQTYYHNASVCYPAAGWELDREILGEVTLHDAAKQVPICRYEFSREGERVSVLTFFQVNDELLDQSPRNKTLWTLLDRMTPQLDDSPGTFVQVQVVAPITADGPSANDVQTRFLQAFGTALFQAIP